MVDSGSCINTVTEKVWMKLRHSQSGNLCNVSSVGDHPYKGYSGHHLRISKTFEAHVMVNNDKPTIHAKFFVVQDAVRCLLSKETAEKLKVLKIGLDVNSIERTKQEPFPKVPNLKLSFIIDESIQPKQVSYFRVAKPLEQKVQQKLDELEATDIIEQVNGETPWISPLLVVPKGINDVRLCVDMRNPNKAIKRIHHPMPVIEDFKPYLYGAKVFSRLDIKSAYHHIELDDKSKAMTTFMTKRGPMRYKRLMFGVNCAPEMFQKFMEQTLAGCEGTMINVDDIIVYASDMKQHDERLSKVFSRLKKFNLSLNWEKVKLRATRVEFLGFELNSSGVYVADSKVEALRNFRKPQTVAEIASFLGLITFVGHYFEDLATKAEPLREVIRSTFTWGPRQDQAFELLKKELTDKTKVLGYYSLKDETWVFADASPVGLGAVLIQRNSKGTPRIITFISKTLTDTERRYSQIQKESLALAWAVKKLYFYLYGRKFKLLSDHKPLVYIFGKKPPLITKRALSRAERWALELQSYDFEIEYCKGEKNIADILSRLCTQPPEPFEEEAEIPIGLELDETINPVCSIDIVLNALTKREIEEETEKDIVLMDVIRAHETKKWPESKELIAFRAFENELHTVGTILLRGDRTVIPQSLRMRALDIAHRGHPGVTTMKRTLRERVWWPKMDKDIENHNQKCLTCVAISRSDPPEPMHRVRLPEAPWDHVAIDFTEFPDLGLKSKILVLIDYYSRYVMLKEMSKTDAENTIRVLEDWFQEFGYPKKMRSDNGPPFNSSEFTEHFIKKGIECEKSPAQIPWANGEIERQNRGIRSAMQAKTVEKRNWKEALKEYIHAYNIRPHSVTGKAPWELFMSRPVRDLLPGKWSNEKDVEESWKERECIEKLKGKLYSDKKNQAKISEIKTGDTVLRKNAKTGKSQPNFDPTQKYDVIAKEKGCVVIKEKGVENAPLIKRHVTLVKKLGNDTDNLSTQRNEEEQTKQPDQVIQDEIGGESEARPKRVIRVPKKFI